MGSNTSAGEVRQLLVHDAWKMSEIPPEDLEAVKKGEVSADEVGCLITEVVVPGFVWEDHALVVAVQGYRELVEIQFGEWIKLDLSGGVLFRE